MPLGGFGPVRAAALQDGKTGKGGGPGAIPEAPTAGEMAVELAGEIWTLVGKLVGKFSGEIWRGDSRFSHEPRNLVGKWWENGFS